MTNNPLVEALEVSRGLLKPYEGTVSSAGDAYKVIDAALASSAPTGEREQIVAFLRDADKSEHPSDLADAIARGDHRTQSGEMEGGEHG